MTNCDWSDYKSHILTSLENIQKSIRELREELKATHTEISTLHSEMKKKPTNSPKGNWPPWKYVLLGAIITLPSQLILDAVKLYFSP